MLDVLLPSVMGSFCEGSAWGGCTEPKVSRHLCSETSPSDTAFRSNSWLLWGLKLTLGQRQSNIFTGCICIIKTLLGLRSILMSFHGPEAITL